MTKKNELAKEASMQLVNTELLEQFAGAGLEQAKGESQISYFTLLQSSHPELKEGHPKFVEGAKNNQFIDGITKELFDVGTATVAPVHYEKTFTEWHKEEKKENTPIAHHSTSSAIVANNLGWCSVEKGLLTPQGTVLKENRNFYMLLFEEGKLPRPIVVPFRATAIKEAKRLLTMFNSDVFTKSDGTIATLPMFANIYKLNSIPKSYRDNYWQIPTLTDKTQANEEQFKASSEFFNQLISRPELAEKALEASGQTLPDYQTVDTKATESDSDLARVVNDAIN